MKREYQYNFSDDSPGMFDDIGRQRKADTMLAVLKDFLKQDLLELNLLNVGGSSGIIDKTLSSRFKNVVSIDIDEKAVEYAQKNIVLPNLEIKIGDALNIDYPENFFDVLVCSHIYEHVPDATVMMDEMYRVLKPGGICFFAAGNRIMWNEPHHQLPLLSAIPRPLAHIYIRLARGKKHYYEKHCSYWGLKSLAKKFTITDYTKKIISSPKKYHAEYMLPSNSRKLKLARFITRYFHWLVPSYIWILQKKK